MSLSKFFCQLAALNLIHEIQFIFAENKSDGCSSQYFFNTNELQSLEDGKYWLMKKILVRVLRKNRNVSTNLTAESVH